MKREKIAVCEVSRYRQFRIGFRNSLGKRFSGAENTSIYWYYRGVWTLSIRNIAQRFDVRISSFMWMYFRCDRQNGSYQTTEELLNTSAIDGFNLSNLYIYVVIFCWFIVCAYNREKRNSRNIGFSGRPKAYGPMVNSYCQKSNGKNVNEIFFFFENQVGIAWNCIYIWKTLLVNFFVPLLVDLSVFLFFLFFFSQIQCKAVVVSYVLVRQRHVFKRNAHFCTSKTEVLQ